VLVQDPVEDVLAGHRVDDRLAQQRAEQVDGDAAFPQRLGEGVVLLFGAFDPQHVVEQELVLVGWGEPFQLQVRPVHDHLAQDPDL